jgi:hypothetical protein
MTMALIRPIAEYYLIAYRDSRSKTKYDMLDTTYKRQREMNNILKTAKGVYIFYDSSFRAIYAGKTKDNLQEEMKSALHRDRKEYQSVWMVRHPTRDGSFLPDREGSRKIERVNVRLYDIAWYFSAYQVEEEFIDDLEAFIIRAFANHLTNKQKGRIKLD